MDVRRRTQIGGIKKTSSGGSTTGGSYTVNLNSQWEKTTAIPNPDSSLYDGVYRSSSSYNVNSGVSIMYITIKDCSSFKMYIRSYAESNYDYVMVSQLDKSITGSSSYSDTTLVKAHTRGNQQSGTALSSYTLVEYTGITSGEHTITVVYRKDGSVNNGDDRGYVLIPKSQEDGGDNEGGSSEGSINTDNYLTIEALEDGLTASLSDKACEYCVDGDGNWKSLAAGTATESINSGHTLSFRGEIIPEANTGMGTFTISKKCNLKGNCMSMLFGDNAANNFSLYGKKWPFHQLFYNCTNIVNVSSNFLPATSLVRCCYYQMFSGCTSLITAPELPATALAQWCYSAMFSGCASLTTAPELPATSLADYCYGSMFSGCTSLTTAPELPVTTLASSCYGAMFSGCTSLTTAPELPATRLVDDCYSRMFSECTGLTTAPALPSTTLASECYSYMFEYCTGLTTAPELPATTLANECYDHMFYKCTGLTTAPELPATSLADYCYREMFSGCTKLNYIKMLATDISASGCLYDWVYRVASTGTFVKNSNMTTLPTGTSGIPRGWTVVDSLFPITLVVGDNGQKGIDLLTYVKENGESLASGIGFTMTFEQGQVFIGEDMIEDALYYTDYNTMSLSGTTNYTMSSDGNIIYTDDL